jgi:hypothetical protein
MNQIKKLILGLGLIFTIVLGFIILQVSNQIYKYNRMGAFIENNDLFDNFYIQMQEKLNFIWIIWGVVFILLIIQMLIEWKRK